MKKATFLPDELIINKIILLRDQKVLIDRDLADLYGVETRINLLIGYEKTVRLTNQNPEYNNYQKANYGT